MFLKDVEYKTSLAIFNEDKWEKIPYEGNCNIISATSCVVNKEPYLFVACPKSILVLFHEGKETLQSLQFQTPENGKLHQININTKLQSCVDSDGFVHVFYISDDGVLTNMLFNSLDRSVKFQAIPAPEKPTCVFPCRLFQKYTAFWKANFLGAFSKGNGVDVFVQMQYQPEFAIAEAEIRTCMHINYNTGSNYIIRMFLIRKSQKYGNFQSFHGDQKHSYCMKNLQVIDFQLLKSSQRFRYCCTTKVQFHVS